MDGEGEDSESSPYRRELQGSISKTYRTKTKGDFLLLGLVAASPPR